MASGPNRMCYTNGSYSTWTENCCIHLCSRGFYIVKFDTAKDKDYALNEEPWFWGNVCLFMTLWFLRFDANAMVVFKMPVWVRLHNLLLHLSGYIIYHYISGTTKY